MIAEKRKSCPRSGAANPAPLVLPVCSECGAERAEYVPAAPWRAAMSDALRILRDDARSWMEMEARAGGGQAPVPGMMARDCLDLVVTPILVAIRQGEALAGRPDDGAPAWVDDVIDGRIVL